MNFSSFTIFVTEDCNFNCSYCYQRKTRKTIETSTLQKAIDFFWPFFGENTYLNFTGGEPLLAFDRIRRATEFIQGKNKKREKKIHLTMTTNGSLLEDDIIRFLQQHHFSLLLSFDGMGQDIFRKKGSFAHIVPIIRKMAGDPAIHLETNSVFTPQSVEHLSKSIRLIIELGVENAGISLSQNTSWDPPSLRKLREELTVLRRLCRASYRRNKRVPVIELRKKKGKGIFSCYAGRDRLALTPEGELWGCHLFFDQFKDKRDHPDYQKYSFGDLPSFIKDHQIIHPRILSNYSKLRQDRFTTSSKLCCRCGELEDCRVCPMDNLLSGSNIREVSPWTCETGRILREERRRLWEQRTH